MDHLIVRCHKQLSSFRIKELKDVLTRLGLPKQGKKQVLLDKIHKVLLPDYMQQPAQKGRSTVTREEAAKVIDDIYRKLHPGTVELASGPPVSSTFSEEPEEKTWVVRCPCGSTADTGTMIQCDNRACGIWQHLSCVVIPENPVEGEPPVPPQFFCELCRINYGDPFCVTLSQPLPAVRFFAPTAVKMEGASPMHSVEKTFTLTKADKEILHRENHDLQVWCMLLNDKVSFRMHWPAYADLRVNGVAVRVTTRAGTQLLGPNGRDDGPGITPCSREGTNRITFTACDARPFCIGVRIVRRLSVEQVMSSIPSVTAGESFEEALGRVNRCINGGGGDAGDDGDSDIEVVADSVTVNLSCPMSGSRINIAGRFKPCLHMGGFDLRTFVEMNQRARKWQCPICMKNYSLDSLIIDPFFNKIAQAMKHYGEDVKEVELKADGYWRPKPEGDAKNKEPWRKPDGTMVLQNGIHAYATVKQEEGVSQGRSPLKIGIKRGLDGSWRLNKPQPSKKPSFSRSSSATDSNNEDEERSVNTYPEYTGDNQAGPQNHNAWKRISRPAPVQAEAHSNGNGNAGDLIVLSDSDEESDTPGATFNNRQPSRSIERTPSFGKERVNLLSSSRQAPSAMAIDSPFWAAPAQPEVRNDEVSYRFFDSDGVGTQAEEDQYEMSTEYGQYDLEEERGSNSLRLFLPSEPARQQQQPRQTTVIPGGGADDVLDDSWFSLSLGGGENFKYDTGVMPSSSQDYSRSRFGGTGLGLSNNNKRNNHYSSRQNHRSYLRVDSDSE